MKKIIRLTESDLTRIVKRVIKEQSLNDKKLMSEQAWLKNLFGTTADDLVRLFGDDAVKSFEIVLQKALQNSKNFVTKSGQNYLKSARSDVEISMETIKKATQLVSSGVKTADEVAILLPRHLPDGSEFRSVFQKSFSKKPVQNIVQSTAQGVSKLPLGSVGQSFKEMASQIGGWLQVKNPVGNLSGWKFHVYADNLDEAAFLYEKLLPIANKHGAGMKVASSKMLDTLSQSTIQKGKGVTLYLPSSVIEKNAQKEFLSDIQSAIKGYETHGQISGDKMITNNIGYRYELSKPINTSKGVDMGEYNKLYKGNEEGATHNITGNLDLF